MVDSEISIIIKNEVYNYLHISNGPLNASYWISKGLMSFKGGSILIPLLILI
jgi:hypothetical protein